MSMPVPTSFHETRKAPAMPNLDRRTFLASSLALAGTAAFTPSRALARQTDLTIAVIGDGRSGIWASLRNGFGNVDLAGLVPANLVWQPGFTASLPVMEAIRAGGVDFSFATATAIVNAVGAGIPIVPLAAYPLPSNTVDILVHADSDIHGPADLRGKKIAHQNGTTGTFSLIKYLEEAGLRLDDVEAVSLSGAEAYTAFAQRSIDAWIHWQPAASLGVARLGDDVRLLDNVKTYDYAFYVARRAFYEEHPEAVLGFLKAIKLTQAYTNAHPAETVDFWASLGGFDATGFERDVYERLIIDRRNSESLADTLHPISVESAESTQQLAESFHALGVLPSLVDAKGFLLAPEFEPIRATVAGALAEV